MPSQVPKLAAHCELSGCHIEVTFSRFPPGVYELRLQKNGRLDPVQCICAAWLREAAAEEKAADAGGETHGRLQGEGVTKLLLSFSFFRLELLPGFAGGFAGWLCHHWHLGCGGRQALHFSF